MLAERGEDLDAVVEMQVPEDLLVERMLARGRADDTEEVIRRRQQVYRTRPRRCWTTTATGWSAWTRSASIEEITDRVADALRSR